MLVVMETKALNVYKQEGGGCRLLEQAQRSKQATTLTGITTESGGRQGAGGTHQQAEYTLSAPTAGSTSNKRRSPLHSPAGSAAPKAVSSAALHAAVFPLALAITFAPRGETLYIYRISSSCGVKWGD